MLNGNVNRHNCRFLTDANPHWMREHHTQTPEKLNVWLGVVGNKFVGPFFIYGNLNSEVYLRMLQEQIIPAIQEAVNNFDEVWFQQDGAPPHFGLDVRAYLDNIFRNRWIGRRGTIEWPARSPDLTPLDYFVWGYLKDKVYSTKPESIVEMRNRIIVELERVPREYIRSAIAHFYTRMGLVQTVQGEHFEHLL